MPVFKRIRLIPKWLLQTTLFAEGVIISIDTIFNLYNIFSKSALKLYGERDTLAATNRFHKAVNCILRLQFHLLSRSFRRDSL